MSSNYRKISKISPEAYIFQKPFLRGLFLEGLIFGGACVRREICVSKSIGLACSGKEIYHFCFVLLCIRGQIPSTSRPGSLYSEGRFNEGFFALRFWGAYIWRGLYREGPIFGILRYFIKLSLSPQKSSHGVFLTHTVDLFKIPDVNQRLERRHGDPASKTTWTKSLALSEIRTIFHLDE